VLQRSAARLAVLLVVTLLALTCSSALPDKEAEISTTVVAEKPKIEIRVRNESGLNFERVRVRFPETGETDYGAVPNGAVSAYHSTTRAYRYASVLANTGDGELSFQPMDYVGEQELAAGRYTYVLRVDHGVLTIELERDQ
jgi:hypothetical protein